MRSHHHRHRRNLATSLIVVVLALVGCSSSSDTGDGLSSPSPVSSSTTAPATTSTPKVADPPTTPATTTPKPTTAVPASIHGTPDRLQIDSIGVDAPVVDLQRSADQTLEVPGWDDAGWWDRGPEPGDRGPAVIAGHVDSKSGPAVFYRLRDLKPGEPIRVVLDDGRTVTFTVDRSERFAKDAFPTLDVYGLTPGPELRLITCDGDFDRSVGHYVDNLVVYATLKS